MQLSVKNFLSGILGDNSAGEGASAVPQTYAECPEKMDHVSDALQRVAREKRILAKLDSELDHIKPEERKAIKKLIKSYQHFVKTGHGTDEGYGAFRKLYYKTAGASNTLIGRLLSEVFPKPELPGLVSSPLGDFKDTDILELSNQLTMHGVARINRRLSPELVQELNASIDAEAAKNDNAGYNKINDGRTTYLQPALLSSALFRKLCSDPLFYHVCGQYFKTEPILGAVNAWISNPNPDDQTLHAKNAQQFHFDMSNPNFIKVFVYLNDVGEKNGPHCLVPGTHMKKTAELWKDGRISDEEMAKYYPEKDWDYQMGEAGSIFFVDTKAFHKGVPPIEGMRRLAMFYYVDTLFGEPSFAVKIPAFGPTLFGAHTGQFTPRFFERYALALGEDN